MTQKLRASAVAVACLALSACAHTIILTPQDGIGAVGRGTAPGTLVSYHGVMQVTLDGKIYDGEWTMQQDGFVGTGFGMAGGQMATGTVMGASTSGGGKAYLTELGGNSISCDFTYSEWSGTGLGVCRTSAGKGYNLTIR